MNALHWGRNLEALVETPLALPNFRMTRNRGSSPLGPVISQDQRVRIQTCQLVRSGLYEP